MLRPSERAESGRRLDPNSTMMTSRTRTSSQPPGKIGITCLLGTTWSSVRAGRPRRAGVRRDRRVRSGWSRCGEPAPARPCRRGAAAEGLDARRHRPSRTARQRRRAASTRHDDVDHDQQHASSASAQGAERSAPVSTRGRAGPAEGSARQGRGAGGRGEQVGRPELQGEVEQVVVGERPGRPWPRAPRRAGPRPGRGRRR